MKNILYIHLIDKKYKTLRVYLYLYLYQQYLEQERADTADDTSSNIVDELVRPTYPLFLYEKLHISALSLGLPTISRRLISI